MREWLGNWAVAYSDSDLAAILLAIGLIPVRLRHGRKNLNRILKRQLQRDTVLTWRLDDLSLTGDHWSSRLDLEQALQQVFEASWIRVNLQSGGPVELTEWRRFFANIPDIRCFVSLPATGPTAKRKVRMRWPMRISAVGDQAIRELASLGNSDSWDGAVFRTIPLDRRVTDVELLMVAGWNWAEISSQLTQAQQKNGRVSTDLLVVNIDNPALAGMITREVLQWLAELSNASAVVCSVAPLDYHPVRDLVVALSHNYPLDVAVHDSFQAWDMQFLTNAQMLKEFRLSVRASNYGKALRQAGAQIPVEGAVFGPSFDASKPLSFEGLAAGEKSPEPGTRGALGTNIMDKLGQANWHAESDEASELGRLMESIRVQDESTATSRYLQAALRSAQSDERLCETIEPDSQYSVFVRIGAPSDDYLSASEPFPDLPPVEDGNCHELTVTLWESELSRKPQRRTINLPVIGDSSLAEFKLNTLKGTRILNARITVLHRGRVLQTGTLSASVDKNAEFKLDAVIRRQLSGLDERQQFDASFVLNDLGDAPSIHTFIGDKAVVFNMDHEDVQQLTERYQAAIAEITEDPGQYTDLFADGTQRMLRELATKGARFRETLNTEIYGGNVFTRPEYIQVVAAQSGKLLPVEFAYDYEVPKPDAKLCPNAAQSLKDGACSPACPCFDSDHRTMREYVCPLGFWGMRAVIERPQQKPVHSTIPGSFALLPEPLGATEQTIQPLKSLLCAASNVADNQVPGTVSSMWKHMQKFASVSDKAEKWVDWESKVSVQHPSLLALLVHQEADVSGTPVMHIGNGDNLSSDHLYKEFVRTRDSDHPIVLLIGCEVAVAEISYESLTALFQKQGASLVVGSLARILGREAGPLMAELVESFANITEPTSLGAVLRDLRRKLLREGNPTVLALVGIGDADWKIIP